jgi:Pentapeptide repeats (8 copies)
MAHQEQIVLLKQNITMWNWWRKKHSEIQPDLSGANLSRTDLHAADLNGAILLRTNLSGATLTYCSIDGLAVGGVKLEGTKQDSLIITPPHEPMLTVDTLKLAQFISLLLNTQEIREVIDTITTKVVLIVGHFTPERKSVLDALRKILRIYHYSPIVFDFERPASRDSTEMVNTLAHLARFMIVDLTDASSAPQAVATIIPQTVVPVLPLLKSQPLIIDGKAVERREYAMFEDLRRSYEWVLPTVRYLDKADLVESLRAQSIEQAEQKAQEVARR